MKTSHSVIVNSLLALGLLGCASGSGVAAPVEGPAADPNAPTTAQAIPGHTENHALAADHHATEAEKKLVTYTEERDPCLQRNANRNVYFGDLHVHTGLSFDANVEGVYDAPITAYVYALGAAIGLPPRDKQGRPMQYSQLARPLDFAAVTDHSEYFGEVYMCVVPGSFGYESRACKKYRQGGFSATRKIGSRGVKYAGTDDAHDPAICGEKGIKCKEITRTAWQIVQDAAELAYDRTEQCLFTSFVGFEWTGTSEVSNLHRNVLFRNKNVPAVPTSFVDLPQQEQLWDWMEKSCLDSVEGCDVLAIPHNSNLSNGKMFTPLYPGAETLEDRQKRVKQRHDREPLIEIFQHKGNSECMNGLPGVLGQPDELCEIEQIRRIDGVRRVSGSRIVRMVLGVDKKSKICKPGETTPGGMVGLGCISRYDFVRPVLVAGLEEEQKYGTNPYRLGIIGSTDTHMATPGATDETTWMGHLGYEAKLESRLGESLVTGSIDGNPGGIAGVWAVENSRDALFDALTRRETFGTSGPRMAPRFFAGFDLPDDLCGRADMVDVGYEKGVPMGGELTSVEGGKPRFVVQSARATGNDTAPLAQIQIVKGWIAADGSSNSRVYDVAGKPVEDGLNEDTCEVDQTKGAAQLCSVFEDPEYDPKQPAVYYARIVQAPTCRWNHKQCTALEPKDRPSKCATNKAPKVIHELAWTSPIWIKPPAK